MPSRETIDAFGSAASVTALALGLAALAVGVLLAYLWRRSRRTPAPVAGILLTGAAMAAVSATGEIPAELWVGVALLVLGGVFYPRARRAPLLPVALAIPGAWWVTRVAELPGAAWVAWFLFGWIVIGAPLVSSFDRHFADRGYGPVLLAVSIAGMFTTLPDTEEILPVLAAAIPLVLLAWPKVLASLGSIGGYTILGVLAWVIAEGGRGRESAIIGATACLALLVVEPPIRWWRGRTPLERIPDDWRWVPIAAGLQLVPVYLVARWAGLSDTPLTATMLSVLVLSIAGALLAAASLQMPPGER